MPVQQYGAMHRFEGTRLTIIAKQALALAQHQGECERAHTVDEACGEQSMHKLGAALRDGRRVVLLVQFHEFSTYNHAHGLPSEANGIGLKITATAKSMKKLAPDSNPRPSA